MEISAGEFKARCLKLMDEVARTGEPLVITKRGRPVARLVPAEEPAPRGTLFGYMAGTATILGDIVDVPHDTWAAEMDDKDDNNALFKAAESSAARYPKARPRGAKE